MTPTQSENASRSRRRSIARGLLGYVILPNLAFWVFGFFAYLTRPLVNVDYVLIGILAPWVPAWAILTGLVLVTVNDVLVSVAPVYHFALGTALRSVRYAFTLGSGLLLLLVALLANAAIVALASRRVAGTRPGPMDSAVLVLVGALIVGVDVLGGSSRFSRAERATNPINVATSAAFHTAANLYSEVTQSPPPDGLGSQRVAAATERATAVLQSSPGSTHLVVVMIESLGSAADPRMDSIVLAPLLSERVGARYDVRLGTVPYEGATTSGEFRELCGVHADYGAVDRVRLEECLPALAKEHGFRTVALHGYSGRFFRRYEWYPRLGFEEIRFAEQLMREDGVRQCGALFRGIRDSDVARIVARELLDAGPGEPQFVYWLTLNSHLPVDVSCGGDASLECGLAGWPPDMADLCALARVHRSVLQSIADLAHNPSLEPTRFIVVGDHPPPFLSRERRGKFREGLVPFVELIPRGGS